MPRHQSSGHLDKPHQATNQQTASNILQRRTIAATPNLECKFQAENVVNPFHESRFKANFSQVPCQETDRPVTHKSAPNGVLQRMKHGADDTDITQKMMAERDQNLIPLFRKCNRDEADATIRTKLAGGQSRILYTIQTEETQAIEQVGNNEGVVGAAKTSDEEKIRKLQEILAKHPSSKAQINTERKNREVVEYSHKPWASLDGVTIEVAVNRHFTREGSGLTTEGGGGVLLQIGTPLSSAKIMGQKTEQQSSPSSMSKPIVNKHLLLNAQGSKTPFANKANRFTPRLSP